MAELLIKAVNATHADAGKDQRGSYKRGDIVDVRPDGYEWGRLELLPPAQGGVFVIVAIADVTVDQVRNFVQNRWGCQPDGPHVDANKQTLRRRKVQIDISSVPAGVRNTLNQTGRYQTTWSAIRQFVKNKLTADTADNSAI